MLRCSIGLDVSLPSAAAVVRARLHLLVLIVLAAFSPHFAYAQSQDGWLLTYVWSAQACQQDLSSDAAQCIEPHGFVVRDLRRPPGRPDSRPCTKQELSRELVARLIDVTLNKIMAKDAWDKYGKCGGLSPTEYVSAIELVDRRIQWPDAYSPQESPRWLTITQLSQGIVKLNPQISQRALSFGCRKQWLEQVQICLNSNFVFSQSSCVVDRSCASEARLRGLLPGVRVQRR